MSTAPIRSRRGACRTPRRTCSPRSSCTSGGRSKLRSRVRTRPRSRRCWSTRWSPRTRRRSGSSTTTSRVCRGCCRRSAEPARGAGLAYRGVMPERKEVLDVAGRDVAVSNPDKVFFPALGLTKLDLVRYYLSVADGALGGIDGRPMALKQYVNGADGEFFFQKRAPSSRPPWIETVE